MSTLCALLSSNAFHLRFRASVLNLSTTSLWLSWHNVVVMSNPGLFRWTRGVFTMKDYTAGSTREIVSEERFEFLPNTSISISFGCSNDNSWILDSIYDLNNRILQFWTGFHHTPSNWLQQHIHGTQKIHNNLERRTNLFWNIILNSGKEQNFFLST